MYIFVGPYKVVFMYKFHYTIVILVIWTLWPVIALQKYHMEKHPTTLITFEYVVALWLRSY